MAARDLTLHISSKLAGEWSAPNVAGMLTAPVLEYLVSKWSDLDTMVKTRLLLAPLAMKGASLEELRPQLQAMVEAGVADKCAVLPRWPPLGVLWDAGVPPRMEADGQCWPSHPPPCPGTNG
uniref:Uncharacterized protein n=1 Tax=Auxenochlorella protothecoides TaxID=3075 RepID=A0A1D2AH36_AUXPR